MPQEVEKVEVSIPQVITWIKEGMDRKDIAEKLGLTITRCRETVFQHPEIKGIRKPQKAPVKVEVTFTDEDTTAPREEVVSEPVAELQPEVEEKVAEEEEGDVETTVQDESEEKTIGEPDTTGFDFSLRDEEPTGQPEAGLDNGGTDNKDPEPETKPQKMQW